MKHVSKPCRGEAQILGVPYSTQVVQDTARGAQESASSAGQLAQLADELQHLVGHFRLTA